MSPSCASDYRTGQDRREWYLLGQRQSQAEGPKGTFLFPATKEIKLTLWNLSS